MALENQYTRPWTDDELAFLRENYPLYGKRFCVHALQRGEGAIRHKASELGLRQDRTSPFFADWQQRAAQSKVGKKRPDQAEVMARLHREGKLQITPEQCEAISLRQKEWLRTHEHPRGMQGKHHTEEFKEFMAMKARRRWVDPSEPGYAYLHSEEFKQLQSDLLSQRRTTGNMRSGYSRGRQGKREDLGGLYVRSGWEANFCRYLNWLQARGDIYRWEYEADVFYFEEIKRGTRSYTPDYKIWETPFSEPYYIELKGWMDQISQTKLTRMAKYYPHIRVDVVDQYQYKDMAMKLSRLIPEWE